MRLVLCNVFNVNVYFSLGIATISLEKIKNRGRKTIAKEIRARSYVSLVETSEIFV